MTNQPEAPEILTVSEVAKICRISVPWVRLMTQKNQIPHYRIGRRVLFKRRDVEAWFNEHAHAADSPDIRPTSK